MPHLDVEAFRQQLEAEFQFPRNKIIIAEQGIQNTKDQIASFPAQLVDQSRCVVLITDAYHIPRARRYLAFPDSPIPADRLQTYPALPLFLRNVDSEREIDKIIEYTLKGDLPYLA